MIKSMTGFGRGSSQIDGRAVTVELKSVNSRYLEIHARLPREYAALESAAKSCIRETVRRGRVDLTLTFSSEKADRPTINADLVRNYLGLFKQLGERFGLSGEVSLATLIELPGVMEIEGNPVLIEPEIVKPALLSALREALSVLQAFRRAEGESLAEDLASRLRNLSKLLELIHLRTEGLLDHYQKRLAARMRKMIPEGSEFEDRIIIEAAVYAEKADIGEEIVRLRSHVEQFENMLKLDSEVGKQLDFLLQEMNREANTILSKAGPAGIAQMGVEMKAEIEKLREQVQNVE